MKRQDCKDPFLRGYLDAALFTTDPEPPAGSDYVECGRADELYPALDDAFIASAKADCAKFESENESLLSQAGDYDRNGADFWYTRNHHGVGFWDRGYDDDVATKLTKSARQAGEHYLLAEDFGLVTPD